ncbi:addiction module antidote protein [Teredinibacter turnerae T7901]|uniref:Antitoxin ParD n=1 Tax=Teredinibacter turnerae (strain ATCC 39867 / T7901) TaxID=377629 RepID=C5BKD5_TERTT|nr:type II toxin-antitoxin system ParD family antitoxin [Teredinibacter turnerae]ACR14202.1 addiction module antidote protein [Teredinibacter turnerae T7901]
MADTITFRPTDEQGGFIEGLIKSGDFASQSEVIRAGIRLLQEQQASSKLAELRKLLQEGEDSPVVENWSADEFIERMKKKHDA